MKDVKFEILTGKILVKIDGLENESDSVKQFTRRDHNVPI